MRKVYTILPRFRAFKFMTGLLSDDGFIYQRKVIIYHVLEELLNINLAECRIKLVLIENSESDETYNLDFFIKTNENKHKYYEVKNKGSLYLKSELTPIISSFYKLYKSTQSVDCQYILIHSSQIKGQYLENMHFTDITNKHEAINKLLSVNVEKDFADRVYCKQILDEIDVNLTSSFLELRCTGLIDKMLKRYNILRYGSAESIYHALRTCYENLVSEASVKIKKRIVSSNQAFPIKESVVISLYKLVDFNNSIIDEISKRNRFSDRDEAVNDFYSKFGVPGLNSSRISI